MKVVWTQAAQADLEEIADYIKADNMARATSFVHEAIDAGEAISDFPTAFPLVPGLEHRGIRRRTFGRYLIFYRVAANRIQILHVVHSARDYIRLLFRDV